jgi:hypothetical protein
MARFAYPTPIPTFPLRGKELNMVATREGEGVKNGDFSLMGRE